MRFAVPERWMRPELWVEVFALVNLAFLTLDIYVAHSYNHFESAAEWIPFGYSLAGPLLLVVGMIGARTFTPLRETRWRWMGLLVGWAGVIIGVSGLIFHLQDTFFEQETLRNLVYTAPFVAPLSYAGIGLLLIMNRMVRPRTRDWAHWVIFLALGGFIGNFILSLADHAQNGFFNRLEWIPVISSAIAIGFLLTIFMVELNRGYLVGVLVVMAVQILVGLLGFGLHLNAVTHGPMGSLWDNTIYGTPVFAPLLFANLALLAVIGLWELGSDQAGIGGGEAHNESR